MTPLTPPSDSDPPGLLGLSPLRGRVLIVDDSADVRQLCARNLGRWGLLCETAADGYEALALARRQSFDAILMDWQMPRMDGLATIRELRRLDVEAPIVLLTAAAGPGIREQVRERCRQAGGDLLLVKPIDFRRLHRFLSGLLVQPPDAVSARPTGDGGSDPGEDGAAELAALVSGYLDGLPETVARLETAFKEKDWHTLNTVTHQLAGTAGTYGLDEVYEAAETLETAGREEDADTAELALRRLAASTRNSKR